MVACRMYYSSLLDGEGAVRKPKHNVYEKKKSVMLHFFFFFLGDTLLGTC